MKAFSVHGILWSSWRLQKYLKNLQGVVNEMPEQDKKSYLNNRGGLWVFLCKVLYFFSQTEMFSCSFCLVQFCMS